jgi:arylsulfatase A
MNDANGKAVRRIACQKPQGRTPHSVRAVVTFSRSWRARSDAPRLLARLLFLVLALLFPSGTLHAQTNCRPNIIFILADDLGYGDVRCYNPQSKIPTPNLDRLAAEGIRFTDAHAPDAACTPTRYGVLTGRYCFRSRLKAGVLTPWDPPLIEEGRLTVPALLRENGYATACVGKWHLG